MEYGQAAMAASEGLKGLGTAFGAMQSEKDSKRKAKEQKRRTLAELLNAALQREFEGGEKGRDRQTRFSSDRAAAMQNLASQYIQALR